MLSAETLQAWKERQDIFKVLKEKNPQPRLLYPARISFKIDGGIKKLFRQAKVEWIQYHQTSFTTNVKGTYLGSNHKRKERPTKTIKKMPIGKQISIITLNVNRLNTPTKNTDWLNGYKSKTHLYTAYKRPTSDIETHIDWNWEDWKIYSMQMDSKRKLE